MEERETCQEKYIYIRNKDSIQPKIQKKDMKPIPIHDGKHQRYRKRQKSITHQKKKSNNSKKARCNRREGKQSENTLDLSHDTSTMGSVLDIW